MSDPSCPKCGQALGNRANILSPVPELANTNLPPTAFQSNLIRSSLIEVNSDISSLNGKIEEFESRVAELKRDRDALQGYSNHHKGILSAIRRFPPEILGNIFHEIRLAWGFTLAFQPSLVCTYWRDVANSTPSLWATIHWLTLSQQKIEFETEMLKLWLARSGSCSLSVHIGSAYSYQEVTMDNHPAIAQLAAHAHRWQNVRLRIPSSMFGYLQAATGSFPQLQTLDIGSIHLDTSPLVANVNTFQYAPQLCKLSLGSRMSLDVPRMPWSQLIECRMEPISNYTVDECFKILEWCANLQVYMPTPANSAFTIPHTPIQHTRLRRLTIEEGSGLGDLFEHLSLPALQTFEYDGADEIFPINSFNRLLSRSPPSLLRLSLTSPNAVIGEAALLQCLQLCPLLENLELLSDCAFGFNIALMVRLTHIIGTTTNFCCLLPRLKKLKVAVHPAFNFQAFADMVESRWRFNDADCGASDHQEVYQIREVQICHQFRFHVEDEPEDRDEPACFPLLRQLRGEGLHIHGQGTSLDGYDSDLEEYLN